MQNNQTINQLKSLVSFIAHESRNSVAVIKGSCEIVKENLDEMIQFVDLMQITANRGLLINEMILILRIFQLPKLLKPPLMNIPLKILMKKI